MEFRPGRLNTVADALSRRDQDQLGAHLATLSGPSFQLYHDLKSEIQQLGHLRELRDTITATRGDP